MKFAPAKKFHQIWWSNPSPASIFSKISNFRNSGVMHRFGWPRITFSICNGQPSYFQKIKFKHVATTWAENFSRTPSFREREFMSKTKNIQIVQAHSCEQLPLLVQFLYGVTTLRDTWIENRGAAKQWNSRQRGPTNNFKLWTPPDSSTSSKINNAQGTLTNHDPGHPTSLP